MKPCAWLSLLLLLPLSLEQAQQSGTFGLGHEIARLMTGKPGAVVVLDVASGKIVAQWHLDVAARRIEAPGSAIKPFILKALLDLGRIQPEQKLACHRRLSIAGRRMDCTHSPVITAPNAVDALAYSCNSYFATVATRLSAAEEAAALRRAGLASPTGLAANEAVGTIIPATTEDQRKLQALGAWGVETTPLELLAAYRQLALDKLKGNTGAAEAMFDGLTASVLYGMAHAANPQGISAAGKTGTSPGTHDPYTHGFFAGYAPAEKPEIVLVVYLEHGHGSDAAAIAAPVITSYWQIPHKSH